MALLEAGDLQRHACMQCGGESIGPVLALARSGLPPGDPGHNIGYQHSVIVLCEECGAGYVEVRDHDCFDFEAVFDQCEWFSFDRTSGDVLRSGLPRCTRPLDAACACSLHDSLRETRLSVRSWTAGFEAGSHVQPVAIVLQNGLPWLTPPA